ncbi:DUF4815 domain-containing protein [Acidovorax sp. GBBC 3334]|uniref:DUF4815 domain-containing protein n=1 Tax=Acidovorax sp. GBBC 3334 TaxID=2940496 RepID=UPI002303E491|nr:DUF4815 domain-containing protein [Acidovorax sp. GBBC 3334]MDA8455260.1 DUF4815 domain-containing protein [Acidovorax sp. GBBC 3334]
MTQANPLAIYERFDPAKNYDRIRWRADKVLQSAELNDLEDAIHHRIRGVADILMKEGSIVSGSTVVVNHATGATTCEAGTLYVSGAVRSVPAAQLIVNTVGVVFVGVYITREIVTELQDPDLLNPAVGTDGYKEPGAARERASLTWGVGGSGQPGDFFPVWTIEDGWVRPKEAPPNIDAVTRALERYDVDSAGGTYIVRGMELRQAADLPTGEQVYNLAEGAAHIGGRAMELPSGRRIVFNAQPDLQWVDSEPHLSTTDNAQRITYDRWPMVGVPQVRAIKRRTVDVVHGGFVGAADPLPDNSVQVLETIQQGATVYAVNADYKLTAGQVDWSPAGAEPAPGSTYKATYLYIAVVEPTGVDSRGFTVQGAVTGTTVLLSYHYALRRVDRLTLDREGTFAWVRGVPAPWAPIAPQVPTNVLAIASVYQSWDDQRRVTMDGVRAMPMDEIAELKDANAKMRQDLAEIRLAVDISGRYSGIKKGLFADPMLGDEMRDAGQPQTGLIVAGALRLPIAITVSQIGTNITTRQSPAYTHRAALSQTARTGSMLVNPYSAFDPLPRTVTLTPAVDRWTDVYDTLKAPTLIASWYNGNGEKRVTKQQSTQLEYLRQIAVRFDLDFGPGEALQSITFDGLAVQADPLPGGTLVANAAGVLSGTFDVPAGIPAGTKTVEFRGTGGSAGSALFTGQGERLDRELSQIIYFVQVPVDPLMQTLMLDQPEHSTGVELWFTAKGTTGAVVQLREAENSIPTRRVMAEARLLPAAIKTDGTPTAATWSPVALQAGREYAIVVLSDDDTTALALAKLSGWDMEALRWVTSQPYQVGVFGSSSNAAAWTFHQDMDMTFRLLAANYTETERVIDLGTVNVVDATDLCVQAYAHQPSAAASCVFDIAATGIAHTVQAAAGQLVELPARYTGPVQVKARLRGDAKFAAVLEPGIQLLAGSLQNDGDYITPMLGAGGNVTVRVTLEAFLPAGSSLTIQAKADAPGTQWVDVPYLSSSAMTAGVMELTYELQDFAAERLRLRVAEHGGFNARPWATNLRAVVL